MNVFCPGDQVFKAEKNEGGIICIETFVMVEFHIVLGFVDRCVNEPLYSSPFPGMNSFGLHSSSGFRVGQSCSMLSMAAWITKRKRIVARLSPCFTPDREVNSSFSFLAQTLTMIFVYIFLIIAIVASGMPYLARIAHNISLFTESKAFMISTKRT